MRNVAPHPLWVGHAGDGRDAIRLLEAGIAAVVDLALEEPPASLPRELVLARIPLIDGPGNAPWRLRAAIETVAGLLRSGVPTLVCCGAGMSRAPAIAAAALASSGGRPAEAWLEALSASGACDISPGLWGDVAQLLERGAEGR